MTGFVLAYGDDLIPYQVSYADNRKSRVAIHVNSDGSVAVDAPHGFSDDSIKLAVQKRAAGLYVMLAKSGNAMPTSAPVNTSLVNRCCIWGAAICSR